MTEKEFRKLVFESEISKEERTKINEIIEEITNLINNQKPSYILVNDICRLGSLKYSTMIKGENIIHLGLDIDVDNAHLNNIEKNIILNNSLENLFLLNLDDASVTRKDSITINYQNYQIYLKIIKTKETNVIEKLNNDYPLFRNTISILKQNLIEQKINTISDEILINLLGYSLKHYLTDNRYEGYVHAFIAGIDDFLKGSYIDLDKRYYQEFNKEIDYKNKSEYTIINFDNGDNLTMEINQNTLNDYRKFRKAIQKLTSVVDIITNNKEINIDINPKYNPNTKEYNWSYTIENINLNVTGGSYKELNNENKYDAITKAFFKALKVVVEKNFSKSNININTKGTNIFDEELDVNSETTSRIKSIKKYIQENNLKVNIK